jgi:DNA-binding transcriptional LysR family regulator
MQPYLAEDIEAGHLIDIFPERRVRTIGHWFLTYPKERANIRKVRLFQEWLKGQISEDATLVPLIDAAMATP